MTCMVDEILLQEDYPDPADAPFDLNPDVPTMIPTLPILDLGITAVDEGSQDPASIQERASINYFSLQTLASKWDRASIQTRPLFG